MMRKSYQQLMHQIHVPTELNEKVLSTARCHTAPASQRRAQVWFKPALCAVCAVAILIGGFSFFYRSPSVDSDPAPVFPFGGLVMTACAAEAPTANSNGGLGLTLEKDGIGGCLFQLQGDGVQTLTLSIDNGSLYHVGTDEVLTEIQEGNFSTARYGVRLNGESAILTVTANETNTFTYLLTQEDLRITQDETGQVVLAPQLSGDPLPGMPGIYAASLDSSRWFAWPLSEAHTIDLSMPYGERVNPVTEKALFHAGIDIPAPVGAAISAAANGKVVETGFDPSNGNYIVLDHGDGLMTRYHHCKELCVDQGASVKAGETIALVGQTGQATGPHLHFEVRQDGVAQDPTIYFDTEVRAQLEIA